jgi:hypothetical protein
MPITPTPAPNRPPDPSAADEGSLVDLGAADPPPVPEVPTAPTAPTGTDEPEPPADEDGTTPTA